VDLSKVEVIGYYNEEGALVLPAEEYEDWD